MKSALYYKQTNHEFIKDFLQKTSDLEDPLAEAMKATISQFLADMRNALVKRAEYESNIQYDEFLTIQIESLRNCVLDLIKCIEFNKQQGS